jgi:sulfate adenylyltransferase
VTVDQLPADLATWPAYTPGEAQLGELELLLSGAYAPLDGYLTTADLTAVAARKELADGTPWPVPVTLTVPADILAAGEGTAGDGTAPGGSPADKLVLQDPEGSPLAVLSITERTATDSAGTTVRLAGKVTALRAPEHGPFRALRKTPEEVRPSFGDGPVLALATRRPLTRRHIGQLRHLTGQLRSPDGQAVRILLLPLVAGPAAVVKRPEALVRSVRAASRQLPENTVMIPVPLPPRGNPDEERATQAIVAAAYGATHVLVTVPARGDYPPEPPGARPIASDRIGHAGATGRSEEFKAFGVQVVTEPEWAYDPEREVWRPLSLIESGAERGELSDGELGALLDAGDEVPAWLMDPDVAAELRRARPPRSRRGVVVFMTGLSGSGKSTLARDLRDALAERGDRTVSLLDGDLVRQMLSAGLSFSRADRDLNVKRIGYVAAEAARHGGIAICAPIAPYEQARAAVRAMAAEAGDFVLIHVATPLEACEARDRKGLYAKARAGIVKEFTGISDPYEEPADADLTIDTSVLSRHDAVTVVLNHLTRGGWLSPID